MLDYTVIGPRPQGIYLVGYQTPGCHVFTPVCECRTPAQAAIERTRLAMEQKRREEALQDELDLLDRYRIRSDRPQ